MKHICWAGVAACLGLLATAGELQAQVVIRAPFVRVGVGTGVYVRAPFVNLYVPGDRYYFGGYYPPPPVYGPPIYGPGYYPDPFYIPPPRFVPPPMFIPPEPRVVERPPAPKGEFPPPPKVKPDDPPPIAVDTLTVDDFVKTFKPRAGNYELDLINPVTKKPTTVRFSLPEGTPKSVEYRGNTVEFRYGPLRFVRIEFDKDGAVVTSR